MNLTVKSGGVKQLEFGGASPCTMVSAVRNTANAILISWLEYQVQNVTMPIHVHVPPIV